MTLPDALAAMAAYNQWIPVLYVPQPSGKIKKLPLDHRTLEPFPKDSGWQQDPAAWTSYEAVAALGPAYGTGFLFTPADPFFFVDIDNCLCADHWSDLALTLIGMLPGAAVEVSISGKGLHIFGTYAGQAPPHGCLPDPDLGLFTESRFVALTADRVVGNVSTDCTVPLTSVITTYFPPSADKTTDQHWTTEPVPGYTGPSDDDELLVKAMSCVSTASVFNGRATLADLWNNNEEVLSRQWPHPDNPYDASSADAALAQHLAFWTGKNCERIQRLMERSALVREKWDREDYLPRTILRACAMQDQVYSVAPAADVDTAGLKGTPPMIAYAAQIRARIVSQYPDLTDELMLIDDAGFWINNKDRTGPELIAAITPISAAAPRPTSGPEFTAGYQLLSAAHQPEHFRGCVYVQDQHRIFTPSGALLKPEQFNATYGGFLFEVGSGNGAKPTKKAWDAFTESQLVRYPIAESICFRPQEPPGAIIESEGQRLVNTYIPFETRRVQGDPNRFLVHLDKLFPNERDKQIILSYMAACVQYKGVKFQWAPLVQGVQGNGKSLLSRCLVQAIGKKYSHMPRPHTISDNFNAWQFFTLFIGIEDIYIPEQRRELAEIMKPMITGEWAEVRKMQTDAKMLDCCCNFLFNSNHKDAVQKNENDRRYCIFYCPQQRKEDLERDGLNGDYFPSLYRWLKEQDGYAIVTNYLHEFRIPDELNPATLCHREPGTSTTAEAITASMGPVEQKIMDAVEEGLLGFCGGWISSAALDTLLKGMGRDKSLAINKRREILQNLGYDWHPALRNGRVNNLVLPDNGKPKLFIKRGHIAASIETAAMVEKEYQRAQQGATLTGAAAVFSQELRN